MLFMYFRRGRLLRSINIPGQVVASVAWGGEKSDILFVSTGARLSNRNFGNIQSKFLQENFVFLTADIPRDFFSGINLSSALISHRSGMIFAVTGLNARGVRQKPICRKSAQMYEYSLESNSSD